MGKTTATGASVSSDHPPTKVAKKAKKIVDTAVDSGSSVTKSKDIGTHSASEATGSISKKISKKKSKNPPIAQSEEPQTAPVESPKKSKKRKRRAENPDLQMDDEISTKKDVPEEPPKKKHKNRTEFKDPREDITLNSQSRKALEYAFLQMNRPSKWKFNKARQNWLIRNILNPDAVSEIYFPFVLKYLMNVQGGSREKLKESCQTYMKIPESIETPTQASETAIPPPKSILKPSPSSTTLLTPGPLIDPTPTPGTIISSESAPPPAAVADPSAAESLAAIRRQRAKTLHDALCSNTSTDIET